jgi:hypothetical protein
MMPQEPKAALLTSVALYGFAFIIVFASALLFFLPLQVVGGILMLLPFPAMIFGIIIYEARLIFSKLKKG